MPTARAALPLPEATALAQAWADHVAERRGIRLLAIKGAVLQAQGLRSARVSGDVDVLVEPARFDEFVAAIRSAGWTERPATFASVRFTLHSRTFIHADWPCDLDVHSSFPGFLADPANVFDTLWERRDSLPIAHQPCAVTDRVASVLILALHSLRSMQLPRHAAELDHLVSRVILTPDERADAAALAHATGCVTTLETVLPLLGVDAEPSAAELGSLQLVAWRERIAAHGAEAYPWLRIFRGAPWRERGLIVVRAMWPSEHDLRVNRPELAPGAWPSIAARSARIWRGLASLPGAIGAIVQPGRATDPARVTRAPVAESLGRK